MLPPTATLLPLPLARAAPARLFFPAVSSRASGRVVRVGRHGAPEREAALSWRGAADESVNKEKHLVEHTKDRMSGTSSGELFLMELPRAELETVVKDAGGDMGHLISAIHRRAQARKTAAESSSSPGDDHSTKTKPYFPAPDELPKTAEELEGETEAAMPESTHTRLLRRMADHD
uniref:Uncharacterized protein n=1 Tax=Oryza glumipatula TaxID=40148 RepID=A0A0D9ZDL4_9ORYZ